MSNKYVYFVSYLSKTIYNEWGCGSMIYTSESKIKNGKQIKELTEHIIEKNGSKVAVVINFQLIDTKEVQKE